MQGTHEIYKSGPAGEVHCGKHRFEAGNNTDFSNTYILDKVTGYMDCIIKEATEIRLCPSTQ